MTALNEFDKRAALRIALGRLPDSEQSIAAAMTRAELAKAIKQGRWRGGDGLSFGSAGPCEDGPYSWEDGVPVKGDWFARDLDACPQGVCVEVQRCRHLEVEQEGDGHWNLGGPSERETIRKGVITWTQLAALLQADLSGQIALEVPA